MVLIGLLIIVDRYEVFSIMWLCQSLHIILV
jgi:hypothetical protein